MEQCLLIISMTFYLSVWLSHDAVGCVMLQVFDLNELLFSVARFERTFSTGASEAHSHLPRCVSSQGESRCMHPSPCDQRLTAYLYV